MNIFTEGGRANFSTPTGRWMGIGPYYAMFPMKFAFEVVEKYSKEGDWILDPFAGRGSSIYAAATLGRHGVGIEINPVGWLYGHIKLNPPKEEYVIDRVIQIDRASQTVDKLTIQQLPSFFSYCFAPRVLRFLVSAREHLDWRKNIVDATVMAIILVYLHGKKEQSLSNQMRQSKAMHPDYSIKWWQERGEFPPDIDPVKFLTQRIEWRYEKGVPKHKTSRMIFGDSMKELRAPKKKILTKERFSLLFTSPPYFDITNYHYDQWLRLWMLGGDEQPKWNNKSVWQKKFSGKLDYKILLERVFIYTSPLMRDDGIIYVRTDAREFTYETTLDVLKSVFPQKTVKVVEQPFTKQTQTALFGDKSEKPGEIDILLHS